MNDFGAHQSERGKATIPEILFPGRLHDNRLSLLFRWIAGKRAYYLALWQLSPWDYGRGEDSTETGGGRGGVLGQTQSV